MIRYYDYDPTKINIHFFVEIWNWKSKIKEGYKNCVLGEVIISRGRRVSFIFSPSCVGG